jgi:predicted GIY-YIG superfamily endonuclease
MGSFVYMLKGANGRHYLGMTDNLERRFNQHHSGHTYSTRRLGGSIAVIAARRFPTREAAAEAEKRLKSWKNPTKAIEFLLSE